MDKVHPLTEAVARILAAQSPNATYGELANAAIREVLTFEPTEKMILDGTDHMNGDGPPEDVYRAMTDRIDHAANLDFISAGTPALTLKERQDIANAASYIRTLEGLVRKMEGRSARLHRRYVLATR